VLNVNEKVLPKFRIPLSNSAGVPEWVTVWGTPLSTLNCQVTVVPTVTVASRGHENKQKGMRRVDDAAVAQVGPLNPLRHAHENPLVRSVHVPPFRHGLEEHSLTFV
jgi:hypothetical protein